MKSILLFLLIAAPLSAHSETNAERLTQLISINSGSANLSGVLKVQELLKPWFDELGFKTEFLKNPNGDSVSAPLLLATRPGERPEYITFIMHADTVFEPSSPFQKSEMIDPHTLRGPGVIDNKGGILVALTGLKEYFKSLNGKLPKYSLRIEITPNEEVGAVGFHDHFHRWSKDSFMALAFEPSVEDGIVDGRKGNVWYEISVKGKEAHAGVNHQLGINACDILAGKIDKLRKLTDYKKNQTVSIGRMEGGQDKFNIVCGWAKAKMDTRVPSLRIRNELNQKIENILKDPAITFRIFNETTPMESNSISKPYFKRYLELIKKHEGKVAKTYFNGAVGDANHFSREGLIVLDGLGPIGKDMHTENEQINLDSIESRGLILSEFLKTL